MKTVSFHGVCSARASKVLVSKPITTGYIISEIHATFALGCVNKLRLEFLISSDDDAPTTGKPLGQSVLADYGQVAYVVGDNTKKVMAHNVESDSGGTWLKVYAVNDDFYDHDIDVQIIINEVKRSD